jgi:hypothetical protein
MSYRDDDSDGPSWPDMDEIAGEVALHEMVTFYEQERTDGDDDARV